MSCVRCSVMSSSSTSLNNGAVVANGGSDDNDDDSHSSSESSYNSDDYDSDDDENTVEREARLAKRAKHYEKLEKSDFVYSKVLQENHRHPALDDILRILESYG